MTVFSKTFLMLLGLCPLGVQADVPFKPATSYTLTCRYGGTGSVTIGERHNSGVLLLYQRTSQIPDDGYWEFEPTGTDNVFRIKNAVTGQYLQYRPTRIEGAIKGLILADEAVADSTSWKLQGADNQYNIINVADPQQWLNLRTDGTWLLGTYAHSGMADNELFSFYDQSGQPVEGTSTNQPGTSAGNMSGLLDSLSVNGKPAVYDQSSNRYLCSLSESLRGRSSLNLSLTYGLRAEASGSTLRLEGQDVAGPDSISLTDFSCNQSYTLTLLDASGQQLAQANLEFTFLPIVVLNTSPDINGTDYTPGDFRVIDPSTSDYDPTLSATFRYRGTSAQNYQKKAFAVKLKDADGESLDHSYFGLREDNNWILDAMAVDKVRMRNRVSTDLWNAFSTRPYYAEDEPEMNPGTRGHFVEMILNGNYHGLYCMTEKLDRKQLKLKKIKQEDGEPDVVRGVLYKSDQWSYEVLMGHESDSRVFPQYAPTYYNNNSMTWSTYEMDYPDLEDGESIDWAPLYNAVNFVATSSDSEFASQYQSWFDMPVWTDYYLFLDVILATDNHGKNMFLFNYNLTDKDHSQLISMAPWDLDGTWGRRWDGSNYYTSATTVYEDMLWQNEHGELTLYYRLRNNPATSQQWAKTLADRYAVLRSGPFNPDSLKARFTSYAGLMTESGAVGRETTRWDYTDSSSDITSDVSYITEWIDQRMAVLDDKYGYTPPAIPEGIAAAPAAEGLTAVGGQGTISLTATHPVSVSLYTISGQQVRRLRLGAGTTEVSGLVPGLYLVGGHKVCVR